MIASDKRVSLFGNNVDHHDASFSSYLNENNTMVLNLTHPPHINTKKEVEDGEIGIFGAEKYFKGAMDEQISRTPHNSIKSINYHPKDLPRKDEEQISRTPNNSIKSTNYHPKDLPRKDEEPPKPKTGSATPSVRSEASWNSRSGLLANGGNQRIRRSRREKSSSVKNLLNSLGCNCNDKASVKIVEKKVPAKEPVKPPANLAGGFNDSKLNIKKEDSFAFPVLNTHPPVKNEEKEGDIIHVKTRSNSLEVFGSPILEKGKKSFSLERKLTMLNWDGVTPKAENVDIIGENDAGSDASSDLFEIESFSTNGNNSFLARQVSNGRSSNATLQNGYAPSEASIAWSVVTASVAGYSTISDYEDTKTSETHNMANSRNVKLAAGGGDHMERIIKGSTGILSGCNTHKSVRVAGEHVVVSGDDKVTVPSGTTTKERFRLDSMVPIMKLQPETKPMSSLTRGHLPRSSHHLYIQQK